MGIFVSRYHDYCLAAFLDLAYRAPKLIQELLHYNADIVSLQEVLPFLIHLYKSTKTQCHCNAGTFYGKT